jgi:hypothetical protein
MSPFEFFSVALSIILGLAVTRLLSSAVGLFEERERVRLALEPLVWATIIFAWQLQYWWSIFELEPLTEWSLALFVALASIALLLFLSSALILPHRLAEAGPIDLGTHFERDGRWALVPLTFYFSGGYYMGLVYWGLPPTDHLLVLIVILTVSTATLFFVRRGSLRLVLLTAYTAFSAYAFIMMSPGSFST